MFFSTSGIARSPYTAHTDEGFLLVSQAISFFSALRISFSCLSCFLPSRAYTFQHSSGHCILLSWDDLTKNTKSSTQVMADTYLSG